jgi:hypothetical protein
VGNGPLRDHGHEVLENEQTNVDSSRLDDDAFVTKGDPVVDPTANDKWSEEAHHGGNERYRYRPSERPTQTMRQTGCTRNKTAGLYNPVVAR